MPRRRKPRHSIGSNKLPKGAHRVVGGGYSFGDMPKTVPVASGQPTRLRVHAVYRDQIDVKRFAQALIDEMHRELNRGDKPKSKD